MRRSASGVARTKAISASARSASSISGAWSAAGGAREEDHALGLGRDLGVLLHHLRLTPAAAGVRDRDRGPHALVKLATELLDEALLVLLHAGIALGEENLTVPGLHAQELHHRHRLDYVTRRETTRPVRLARRRVGSAVAMRKAEAHGPPPTLFEVVHRGVQVADPTGQFGVADLLPPVEDADEPVTGHRDIELELAELKGRIDPQDEDPAVMMAVAVATYLAFRRDEIDDDRLN